LFSRYLRGVEAATRNRGVDLEGGESNPRNIEGEREKKI
jgi:hypothetical protein